MPDNKPKHMTRRECYHNYWFVIPCCIDCNHRNKCLIQENEEENAHNKIRKSK